MNRTLALILSLLLVAFLLVGCGRSVQKHTSDGSKENTAEKEDETEAEEIIPTAEGVYVLHSVNGKPVEQYFEDETGMDLTSILALFEIDSFDEYMSMELKEDGVAVVSFFGEEPQIGTWEQEDDSIVITIDGDSLALPFNGDELTLDPGDEDEVMGFRRKEA